VGSGEMGMGSGEIELKPQNPKTPKPVSCLLSSLLRIFSFRGFLFAGRE
jgi:hypothetical protein